MPHRRPQRQVTVAKICYISTVIQVDPYEGDSTTLFKSIFIFSFSRGIILCAVSVGLFRMYNNE